ncbi:hypothetical protein ATANTOWER_026610 [Ataeniobius toweri]|uniref:Uncharacterized protein n=1 Tax=Ataeniobius toweri TaxID=208326 RepID=A0ABU7AH32_9TELE|nr:hypothetical protein [Ataeniobius toweri]
MTSTINISSSAVSFINLSVCGAEVTVTGATQERCVWLWVSSLLPREAAATRPYKQPRRCQRLLVSMATDPTPSSFLSKKPTMNPQLMSGRGRAVWSTWFVTTLFPVRF